MSRVVQMTGKPRECMDCGEERDVIRIRAAFGPYGESEPRPLPLDLCDKCAHNLASNLNGVVVRRRVVAQLAKRKPLSPSSSRSAPSE